MREKGRGQALAIEQAALPSTAAGSTAQAVSTVELPDGVETQSVKAFLGDDALAPRGETLALAPQPTV
jgi:hypothetical protein